MTVNIVGCWHKNLKCQFQIFECIHESASWYWKIIPGNWKPATIPSPSPVYLKQSEINFLPWSPIYHRVISWASWATVRFTSAPQSMPSYKRPNSFFPPFVTVLLLNFCKFSINGLWIFKVWLLVVVVVAVEAFKCFRWTVLTSTCQSTLDYRTETGVTITRYLSGVDLLVLSL